tara:strand:+ start:7369 stop:8298 length:930 start_codon:yes stop_codon:yes gene_type:complete
MILQHLINPKPKIIVFFTVLCFLFFCLPIGESLINNSDLQNLTKNLITLITCGSIIYFNALGLNNLIYEKNIIKKDSIVLACCYVLLSAPYDNSLANLIINFSLLFFVNYLFSSYQKDFPLSNFFNATFIISCISLFHSNILILLILILICGVNFENLKSRSVFISFLGFIIPYLFYYVWCFMTDSVFKGPTFNAFNPPSSNSLNNISLATLFWIVTVCAISLISLLEVFKWLYKKSIRSRKSLIIIVFYFLFSCILFLLGDKHDYYFLITPLSIIFSNYFIHSKFRKTANVLFYLFLLSSIICKYYII